MAMSTTIKKLVVFVMLQRPPILIDRLGEFKRPTLVITIHHLPIRFRLNLFFTHLLIPLSK